MKLIRKQDIVTIKTLDYKNISKVIDQFLDGKLLPKYIFKSFKTEYNVVSEVDGVDLISEDISNNIVRASMDLEFLAIDMWKFYDRAKRYRVLLEILTSNVNIDIVENKIKKIFGEKYHPFMADIILNHIDSDGNFTFITKENESN